ncbi:MULTISPECIES: DUF4388 domain-containing protein [unclassified Coleofasciculus]|uniref:DUF4388 domain-containing protein n=1 Tax=unclassified Coleofasciculus TaxID=2692782 RepID=UPI001882BFAF|nr:MULTISPECIES: DUF4388 domain-containing protein [unclassified Coleofasciculus]MBE9129151.1 DUF4388 domain-containing protein [Coleofasciculus sp. LEGE 07081]MBE9151794.1 DUF4388 domain-containing protein [Coleofasciculus sp. LEGE 07092]
MSITGYLSDLSLPEIFHLIEKGQKTGLLTLRTLPENQTGLQPSYYIWMYQGRLVAAANRTDQQGLISLIEQYDWVSDRVFTKLVEWCCPRQKPLGLCLKNHGVLQTEHLKQLFQVQVLQQVCALFQLQNGHFQFNQKMPLPGREMTGLSVQATEVTLIGLRSLRHWDALVDKLPDPNGGLISTIIGQPRYRLDNLEWQIWEYTKGTVSLKTIARELGLPIEKVQQIAFQLITIGLAEEVPFLVGSLPTQAVEPLPVQLTEDSETRNISQFFVQNLKGFLRSAKSKPMSMST